MEAGFEIRWKRGLRWGGERVCDKVEMGFEIRRRRGLGWDGEEG